MKTLLVLRHAKSSWKNLDLDDFDRPLSPRGRKDAVLMGRYMASKGMIPQTVLCSPARRAQSTWHRIASQLDGDIRATLVGALYLASADGIFDVVRAIDPHVDRALLVGHNPGLAKFLKNLHDHGAAAAADVLIGNFPTCALAEVRFEGENWRGLTEGRARIESVLCPADLPSEKGGLHDG